MTSTSSHNDSASSIMTAEEAFFYSFNRYPSVYLGSTMDASRLAFFDHVFNTIGNGIHNVTDLNYDFQFTSSNVHMTKGISPKYFNGQPLFYAYRNKESRGHSSLFLGVDPYPGLYTQEEMNDMDVAYSVPFRRSTSSNDSFTSFYPNFKKQYSLVWQDDFTSLTESWTLQAIEYYQAAKDFFQSPDVSSYGSYYPPLKEQEKNEMIRDIEHLIEKMQAKGMSSTDINAQISKDYECLFEGNIDAFFKRRWEQELKRIHAFLDETIERLENHLTSFPLLEVESKSSSFKP